VNEILNGRNAKGDARLLRDLRGVGREAGTGAARHTSIRRSSVDRARHAGRVGARTTR
jgi:hypothetical protein